MKYGKTFRIGILTKELVEPCTSHHYSKNCSVTLWKRTCIIDHTQNWHIFFTGRHQKAKGWLLYQMFSLKHEIDHSYVNIGYGIKQSFQFFGILMKTIIIR